jgi:hypothetical protein
VSTLYNQCGLSAQKTIARASITAGMIDTQKQTRHLISRHIFENKLHINITY